MYEIDATILKTLIFNQLLSRGLQLSNPIRNQRLNAYPHPPRKVSEQNLLYAVSTAALMQSKQLNIFFSAGQLMTSFLSTMSNKKWKKKVMTRPDYISV